MIESLPLHAFEEEYSNNHIVAYSLDGQPIFWTEMQKRLDIWKDKLNDIPQIKVAVFHTDAIDFLCIVSILWSLKKIPVIPENTLEETLKVVEDETDYLIGEFPELKPSHNADAAKRLLSSNKEGNDLALIILTSGSSGKPKAVYKTFKQLNSELKIIENNWGKLSKDILTLGTVSHHHMFGLQFRLFWPFVSKTPFVNQDLVYLEQLQKLSKFKINLISSPAHLEHLPEAMDWNEISSSMKTIFSAGAPLSKKASLKVYKKIGVPITEVYGSTETGAVSQREQTKDTLWNPLKGISVKKIDKKLAISSPAALGKGWYISDDLCEMHANGSFSLKGRADNIIKVGGKRISKTAIEEILNKHSLIEKAFVVFLKKRKNRVGAVVQLTREGNEELIDKGKILLQKKLSKGLKEAIEKVAWPRYWRFVYEIPINQQGKIILSTLQGLFDEKNKLKFPDYLSQEYDENAQECVAEFILPQNLFYFKGHFQGRPVLPGLVQISWAIHYAQELFGELGTFVRLEGIKFQQVIQPGEKIKLKLRWEEGSNRLFFGYSNKNNINSIGRVVFKKEV